MTEKKIIAVVGATGAQGGGLVHPLGTPDQGPARVFDTGDHRRWSATLAPPAGKRCGFEPGQVRVVMVESSPMFGKYQEYRLVDAATGEFERGRVKISDMLERQPGGRDPRRAHDVARPHPFRR
jgi:transmembrane protein DUF3556